MHVIYFEGFVIFHNPWRMYLGDKTSEIAIAIVNILKKKGVFNK